MYSSYVYLTTFSHPDGLRNAVASFFLRKLVGYPPDLDARPDILCELSPEREQQWRLFSLKFMGPILLQIYLRIHFSERKKLIMTMATHPDIGTDPALAELNVVYTMVLTYFRNVDTGGRVGTGVDDVPDL